MNEPTLRDVEQILAVLTEIDPGDITDPQQLALYEADLKLMIQVSAEKRDRVAAKMFDLGVRAATKQAASQAHAVKARDLHVEASRYEARIDQLKEYVLAVMRELPKPKRGVRTLEGETATFKAKGVPASVEILAPLDVPVEYQTATLVMPYLKWFELREHFAGIVAKIEPTSKAVLRIALEEQCPECGGTGSTGKMVIRAGEPEEIDCKCGGSGKRTIPGVRLVDNKLRLEVS